MGDYRQGFIEGSKEEKKRCLKMLNELVLYHYQRMIDGELESMYVYIKEDIAKLKQKIEGKK